MKQSLLTSFVVAGALLVGGCATKKYVRQTVDPVNGKVDQVAQKTDQQGQAIAKNGQSIDQTRKDLERDETELSATKERAMTADSKAGQAMGRADQASQKADQANQKADQLGHDLGDLRTAVSNLDDYKEVANVTVNFKFDSTKLAGDAKQQLDQMVVNQGQYKRYFVAVEGFTDKTGSSEYNNALSRRRADAVVQYLVAQHNIPIYRIHMVGLGKNKLLVDSKNRSAGAKNRRVEVMLYSADPGAVAMTKPGDAGASIPNYTGGSGVAGNNARPKE